MQPAVIEAVAAYDALDKSSLQGRLLHILGAVDRRGGPNADVEGAEGKAKRVTVKGEKEAKRKAVAGKEFNWSMLYMNSDAVASSIADRMGIPKTAILNPDSSSESSTSNPAVKLALAETHIIMETKAYLESHGVVLSSFQSNSNSRPRRSDTVILVKNIPYGTTETQIRELFEPHGELVRVLVPLAGTIAIVECVKAEEAAKGFRSVVYRRMGNSIVYLEKGPVGMFDPSSGGEGGVSEEKKEMLEKTVVRVSEGGDKAEAEAWGEGETGGAGTTLYVKNLSFATTQEKFSLVLASLRSFLFARIQTKPDPKKPNTKLSMGYGFVGFKDPESTKKALKSMQSFVLDGHELNVKFAGRGKEEMEKDVLSAEKGTGAKARTTKMTVKNVPFEATKKDIRDLFRKAMFGFTDIIFSQCPSVRLPKKFDSQTRGFAFLEFVTRHEAENAFNALKHTHLLGRHLVLEWAAEDEGQDLDALRKKAGVGFGDGKGNIPGRKRKLDMPGKKGEEDPEGLEG
ncbi:hypothetical protein H1R20_g10621, partial [Candolleomyces eurysporus]